MASVPRLVLEFADASGNSVFFNFDYGNQDAATGDVKGTMNTIINCGSIFSKVPVFPKSAKVVITSEREFDLS